MKWLPLLWTALWRKPARSIFTLLSLVVAFLIIGIMTGVGASVAQMLDRARMDRIVVTARFGAWEPVAYADQIERLGGVKNIAISAGIAGTYQTPENAIFIQMTDARVLAVDPESEIPPELFAKLESVRNGVIITQATADRLGWKEGQTYPLETDRITHDRTRTWTFQVVGIRPPHEIRNDGLSLGNFTYLNEGRADRMNEVNAIILLVDDAERAGEVSTAIEAMFANSSTPVSAMPERTLIENAIQATLDLEYVIYTVSGAALFMILFLTGTVLGQSVDERIPEFAVMKAVGFSDRAVLALVLVEASVLSVVGACLGLLAAKALPLLPQALVPGGPAPVISVGVIGFALALAIAVAIVGALPAAWRVRQLEIAEALGGR
jgi:putative ABC transport system permease protein